MNTVDSYDSPENAFLTYYADAFAQAVPHRVVNRNMVAREDMKSLDLEKGVFSLLYQGERPTDDDLLVTFQMLIVGQLEVKESATPEQVEQVELKMLHEFRAFARSTIGSEFHIKSVGTSHQMEHPYGWVMISCDLGPLNVDGVELEDAALNVLMGQAPNTGVGHETDYVPEAEFTREY